MATEAAAYPQDTSTTQKASSNNDRISDTSDQPTSTPLQAAANGQAISGKGLLSWDGPQQATVESEARSVSVWQQLKPQALSISGQNLGRKMRRLSAQTALPEPIAGFLGSEPKLVTGVDVEHNSDDLERGKYAQKLYDRFSRMTEESPHPHRPFLPSSMFSEIHGSDVCAALRKSRKTPVPVEDPESYRKIFYVLCLLKLPTKIKKFIKHGVCDADLPLCVADSRGLWKNPLALVLRSRHGPNTNTVKFKLWSDADDFCKRQWVVLAPKFEGCKSDENNILHYNLDNRHILPFKTISEYKREGSYGEVTQVEIFPDHHSLADNCNIFALKKLKSSGTIQRDFISEVTTLRKLRQSRHEHVHLITLLATFKWNNVYHFIFPWAEADLFGYWRKFSAPVPSAEMDSWIIKQFVGLIEALRMIHRYDTYSNSSILALNPEPKTRKRQSTPRTDKGGAPRVLRTFIGRHGDLKPENNLWFPGSPAADEMNEGVLKIADFGSARFSKDDSWYDAKHNRIPNSTTYQSPEYQLEGTYSTLCDIWALGCIFLEMLTWYFGGLLHIEQFNKARLGKDESSAWIPTDTFFGVFGQGENRKAKVKYTVRAMIENLYCHQSCTPRFKSLLDIIKDQMLVVDVKHSIPADELELQRSTSGSLAVPGHSRSRRNNSSAILHDLGNVLHEPAQPDRNVEGLSISI